MKTGFKNPIEPKESKEVKSPWDFKQPTYDERTSCYVNAGSHYGVGHKCPVGHTSKPKSYDSVIPVGRNHKTIEVSKVPHKNLPTELYE